VEATEWEVKDGKGLRATILSAGNKISWATVFYFDHKQTKIYHYKLKIIMEILTGLNPQQLEAVKTTEGALLILAGAGSGKTRVITVRIAYLIAEKEVAPYHILAVTFTNKAAAEMRERINRLLQGRGLQSAPLISTFHSLCVRILRQDIEHLEEGFNKSFTIYDTDDSLKVIKACVKDIGLDEKQLAARQVLSAISSAKNRGEDFESFDIDRIHR